MAEMLIQSESLTSIADKIRVLSGTSTDMGLTAMENHVDEANTNVATEADLISQISSALEGKAAGSGSGSSGSENTSQVSIKAYTEGPSGSSPTIHYIDANGQPQSAIYTQGSYINESFIMSKGLIVMKNVVSASGVLQGYLQTTGDISIIDAQNVTTIVISVAGDGTISY